MGTCFNKVKNIIKSIPLGVRSAVVYTTATVFSRGLAIITVPIFTRLMSTEQIGVVNLYNTWHGLISVVATLSLTSGGFAVAMKEYEKKVLTGIPDFSICLLEKIEKQTKIIWRRNLFLVFLPPNNFSV